MNKHEWILLISQIIGITAVVLYLLSFQLKRRGQIASVSCLSYLLYVVQYLLLGALSGAVMDVLSAVSSFFAGKKNTPRFRRYAKATALFFLFAIIAAGLILALAQRDWFELLPIAGAALQSGGLWFNNEQTIRIFGMAGAPFWLIYNIGTQAYGAAIGTALTILSILSALARYKEKKRPKACDPSAS